jgi:hypothetical protein
MFTWGSKYLFGIAVASIVGALVYGLVTGGSVLGVLSSGLAGGVGDHAGYGLLLGLAVATIFLGVINVVTRDGDAAVAAASVGVDGALAVGPPRTPTYWAPMAAFGVACLVVGLAVSLAFTILGIAILGVVLVEWTVQAWADRATGDQTVNNTIRNRVIGPLEVPIMASLGIAILVLGVSRVLLTVSKEGATAVASIVAFVVFVVAIAIAKSRVSRSVISGVVATGAVLVLAGGIIGAVRGPREIVHHGDKEAPHAEDGQGEGE